MSDCSTCKGKYYCGYPDAVWYPMHSIVFCRPQMLWLLEHIDGLRDGYYPHQPLETGYTRIDPAIKSQPKQASPFEKAAQIAAEVDYRLNRCHEDGKILEYEVRLEIGLSPEARKALSYISGWKRRLQNYSEWKSHGWHTHKKKNIGKK